MIESTIALTEECLRKSFNAEATFPILVAALAQADIESYHVDLHRSETTYYHVDADTHVVPMPGKPLSVALPFSPTAVEQSVRAAQRGELRYPAFLAAIAAAGVSNYWVYIRGAQVVYVGRNGGQHVEPMP